jgi:hypothetical protein
MLVANVRIAFSTPWPYKGLAFVHLAINMSLLHIFGILDDGARSIII